MNANAKWKPTTAQMIEAVIANDEYSSDHELKLDLVSEFGISNELALDWVSHRDEILHDEFNGL